MDKYEAEMNRENALENLSAMWTVVLFLTLFMMAPYIYDQVNGIDIFSAEKIVPAVFCIFGGVQSLLIIWFRYTRSIIPLYTLTFFSVFYAFVFPIGTVFTFFHFKNLFALSPEIDNENSESS